MLRNFPYFKTSKSSEPLESSNKGLENVCKQKKLSPVSRKIRKTPVRPGIPHQNLIGLLRKTKAALQFHAQSHQEARPSTSKQAQTQTYEDDPMPEKEPIIEKDVVSKEVNQMDHQIDLESEELFKECSLYENKDPSLWTNADVNKKLIYYWTTINSGCPNPVAFKNFLTFYSSKCKRTKKMAPDCVQKKCWSLWNNMRYHEKLPFIVETLITRFSKMESPSNKELEKQMKEFFVNSKKYD